MQAKVITYRLKSRKYYTAQWDDPITGERRYRSTKTAIKRDAERFAARLEDEIKENASKPVDTDWSLLRQRHEDEHLSRLSDGSYSKTCTVMDAVERIINPKSVGAFQEPQIVTLTNAMLQEGRGPSTVASYLRQIRAALHWERRAGMIPSVLKFTFPEGWKRSKGRPISQEEFERMLDACRKNRGETSASWERLLWGLWWSGLRINEIMHLTWNSEGLLVMDFSGKRPMFFIQAQLSKNRKTERFPMAPEFYDLVMQVPESERKGYVFDPRRNPQFKSYPDRMNTEPVSRIIAKFGKGCRVKVADTDKGPRFAASHDLRRSFGFRWAKRVMPAILQRMMRHATIQTTMEYYITQGEQETADAVWESIGSTPQHAKQHALSEKPPVPR
jgi:integrase